jgi:hypothetical protein
LQEYTNVTIPYKGKFRKPSEKKILRAVSPFLSPEKMIKLNSEPELYKAILNLDDLQVPC